jgi:hypothetical protein
MPSEFGSRPEKPAKIELTASHRILLAAHEAAGSFLDTFERVRKRRKALGTPTDEEQDLLRAMLMFAGSGLDAMIKQLTGDALPHVLERDQGAHKMLQEHVQRRLVPRDPSALERAAAVDTRFIAVALTSNVPRDALVRDLVASITAESMQSREQVLRAAAHFGIASKDIASDPGELTKVFGIRNQIGHEMDVDLTALNRKRRSRRRNDMVKATKALLATGANFLREVDKKLDQPELAI